MAFGSGRGILTANRHSRDWTRVARALTNQEEYGTLLDGAGPLKACHRMAIPEAFHHVAVSTTVDCFHTCSSNNTENHSEWAPDGPVRKVELEVRYEEGGHQECGS